MIICRSPSTCGTAGIELRFFAEQPEDAEAHSTALDHEVSADELILRQALETGQSWVIRREVGIRCDHRRNPASLGGHRDGLSRTFRPEVEIMVAKRSDVATDPGQDSEARYSKKRETTWVGYKAHPSPHFSP